MVSNLSNSEELRIKCNQPSSHYSSGRALLLAFDTIIKDKNLSEDEFIAAVVTYLMTRDTPTPELTEDEMDFIIQCYRDYDGNINAMCPPPPTSTTFYILLLAAAIIVLYLLARRK